MRALVIGLAMIAGLGLARVGAGNGGDERTDVRFEQQEALRLEAHFDSVIGELRDARVDHLSLSQQRARASLIDWLREYRDAGRFPRNDRFTRPTPFFRDASGTLCAMAYLIARSGRTDIVDRVASTANNAYIDVLRTDRGLAYWADSVGLTLDEAARVQPSYGGPNLDERVPYAIATGAVGTVAVVSAAFNAVEPSRASGWWGLITGTVAIGLGLPLVGEPQSMGAMGRANVAIGLGSVVLGVRGLLYKEATPGTAPAQAPRATRQREFAVTPIVIPGGRRGAVGIGVGATF